MNDLSNFPGVEDDSSCALSIWKECFLDCGWELGLREENPTVHSSVKIPNSNHRRRHSMRVVLESDRAGHTRGSQ